MFSSALAQLKGNMLKRQEAANMFPAVNMKGANLSPITQLSWSQASRSPVSSTGRGAQTRRRTGESASKRRNAGRAPPLHAGQLALHCVRYVIADEVAGARQELGGVGSALRHLAHLLELSAAQKMETNSHFGKAQRATWTHFARERGDLEMIRGELAQLNRGRLQRCIYDQQREFFRRRRSSTAPISRLSKTQNRWWRRNRRIPARAHGPS